MWLGSWAWDAVAERLRATGHDVRPLTLTGVGERAAEAGPDVDLDRHVADIVDLIEREDLHDVVLVGHSYGGLPVRGAADRVPERIATVVYVDSGPVPDGTAQLDLGGPVTRVGDGIAPPDWDPAADAQNLAGLDGAALSRLRDRSTPHPYASAAQKLRLSTSDQPPTVLVPTTFPAEQVRAMIEADHPFFAGLDRRDYRIEPLPTGHWPMLSRPDDLADLLARVG